MQSIDTSPKNVCIKCNAVFPVLENFLLEARCPPCQAQYRFEESCKSPDKNRNNCKPVVIKGLWSI